MTRLSELEVLVLDCQASGASPAHGDLLEVGWAVVSASAGIVVPTEARWVVPRTNRPISRPVRELTGWSDAALSLAIPESEAWEALRRQAEKSPATVIHWSRFELAFLRDLHARVAPEAPFPFDVLCVHAVGARLFPDLPRRSIRALAGHLGHTTDLMRRSAGHVDATAFVWRALVPLLAERGIETWEALGQFVDEAPPTSKRTKRIYPFDESRRRALPDRPGVYRFVRKNGDVLYVGKATSVKKRVAGHFKSGVGKTTERALEMLSQVDDVDVTITPSILEAALLEADEIKRVDPPYNVHLRTAAPRPWAGQAAERRAWFASHDLRSTAPAPDDAHTIGPLPSARSLASLGAIVALATGQEPLRALRAQALGVPSAFAPDEGLFAEGWSILARTRLLTQSPRDREAARAVLAASLALYRERGRQELDEGDDDAPPDAWDLARVLRRLERTLVHQGLLVRRAPWLVLLADAAIAFRERGADVRLLVFSENTVVERATLASVDDLRKQGRRRVRPRHERRATFDAAAYDRLRVLVTELRRVLDEGGEAAVRVGDHVLDTGTLARLLAVV